MNAKMPAEHFISPLKIIRRGGKAVAVFFREKTDSDKLVFCLHIVYLCLALLNRLVGVHYLNEPCERPLAEWCFVLAVWAPLLHRDSGLVPVQAVLFSSIVSFLGLCIPFYKGDGFCPEFTLHLRSDLAFFKVWIFPVMSL